MKRYLLLLLISASLCCVFQSCEKDTDYGDDIVVESLWMVGNTVIFPEGCRIDEGNIEYGDISLDFSELDATLYATNPTGATIDFECRIEDGDAISDIFIYNVRGWVGGPDGVGKTKSYVYFRGGFLLSISDWVYTPDESHSTFIVAEHNGVEYTAQDIIVSGYIKNNREYRRYYPEYYKSWEEITKNLEYKCDVTFEMTFAEHPPVKIHITHISPL